jgi:hypothetical protein
MSWDDERRNPQKYHKDSELNFRGRVSSGVSTLDVEIGTSDCHRWRKHLNTKSSDLVSLTAGIVFMEMIKTYETSSRFKICEAKHFSGNHSLILLCRSITSRMPITWPSETKFSDCRINQVGYSNGFSSYLFSTMIWWEYLGCLENTSVVVYCSRLIDWLILFRRDQFSFHLEQTLSQYQWQVNKLWLKCLLIIRFNQRSKNFERSQT